MNQPMLSRMLIATLLATITSALAQQPPALRWPEGRSCSAMSAVAEGVVLYGGSTDHCGRSITPDTGLWRWNGDTWESLAAPNGPGSREDVMLSFDSASSSLLLYGGRNGSAVFEDLWQFRDGQWRRLSSAGGPGRVEHAAMAFDPVRRRLVVFGGGSRNNPVRPSADTWEWDGTSWTRWTPPSAPEARVGHSMVWSPALKATVLYGGFNPSASFRDLWRWSGRAWTRMDSSGPTETEGPSLVATERGLILTGPRSIAGNTTVARWLYQNGAWTLLAEGGPPARVGHALAFDARRQTVVFFGGTREGEQRASNDLWELNLRDSLPTWRQLTQPVRSPMDALQPLIGVWDTHDTYHPETGASIVERGVRTCQLVMHSSYVQCETIAPRPNGRERSYRFLINFNPDSSRYEMLSIWSNIPPKLVQQLTPSDDYRRWRITNIAIVGAEPSHHWSELVVESAQRIVWTGRRVRVGQNPADAPVSFRETWTRR
jgi:hypothetical protein